MTKPRDYVVIGGVRVPVYEITMDPAKLREKLVEIIGEDNLVFAGPQFERTDGVLPVIPEKTWMWFDRLATMPPDALRAIGMQPWDREEQPELWLFPGEWYDYIPDGYPLSSINDKYHSPEPFKHGKTDNDIRCGALAYGVRLTDKPATKTTPCKVFSEKVERIYNATFTTSTAVEAVLGVNIHIGKHAHWTAYRKYVDKILPIIQRSSPDLVARANIPATKPEKVDWYSWAKMASLFMQLVYAAADQKCSEIHVLDDGQFSQFYMGEPKANFKRINTCTNADPSGVVAWRLMEYNGLGWVEEGGLDLSHPVMLHKIR